MFNCLAISACVMCLFWIIFLISMFLMPRVYTTFWYIMSRKKYKLTLKQREGIAERIDIIRKSHGYRSFRQFALAWELPENSFHNWAKKGHINLAFLIEFSKTFKVDLCWLITGFSYHKQETPE